MTFRNEFLLTLRLLIFALWQVLLNARVMAEGANTNLSFDDNKFGCQIREWYVIT
jgi:hypothetical protein